jgi:hypothetical protein
MAYGVAPSVGLSGMLSLTAGGEHFQVTARAGGARQLSILGPPDKEAGEVGLLVGYGQSLGVAHFYAAAGMGTITVERRGREIPYTGEGWHVVEYERISQTAFNIPAQVGVDFGRRIVAGGLALVGNLNSAESYVGVLLTVSLGKLRYKAE